MENLGTKSVKSTTKRVTQLEKIITKTENKVKNIDITKFIEENPVAKLSGTYQSELLNIIKTEFTEFDQRVFLFNFYCSFNYDEENDFVIDLNQVWPWLGFTRKDHAKHLLIKEFEINTDYTIKTAPDKTGAVSQPLNGGQNKEQILLTIECFKVFCMTAKKPKAKLIRRYYVKLERLIQQIIKKQSNEMKNLLCLKETENQQLQQQLEDTQEQLTIKREQTLIIDNERKKCLYIGMVTDSIVSFGITDDIRRRTKEHKTIHIGEHFVLEQVYVTICDKDLENAIKKKLKKHIIPLKDTEELVEKGLIKHTQRELIQLDEDFTLDKLKERIKNYRNTVELDKVELEEKLQKVTKQRDEKDCRIKQLEQLLKEANKEIPAEYETVKDHRLETEIEQKISFLEFILKFITDYENVNKLEQCKFYENKKGIIKIEKDDFYNIYEEYVKINKLFSFKIDDGKIANYIPMDSKTIQFLHMKTTRMNCTVNGERFRPTVRVFYINELKEYIPKKIEELKTTSTEKQVKIVKDEFKNLVKKPLTKSKRKVWEFIKICLEDIPDYFVKLDGNMYRTHNKELYDEYMKFYKESNLNFNQFGGTIKEAGIVNMKHKGSKSYKKINKALVEQKLREIII